MKKAFSILLAFVFLISSSGFSINRHYCGGKLRSTNVLLIQKEKSCCGEKEMPEGCCKNQKKVIKIKDSYSQAQAVSVSSTDFTTIFVVAFVQAFHFSLIESYKAALYADSHAPPGNPVSRTILFRTILI